MRDTYDPALCLYIWREKHLNLLETKAKPVLWLAIKRPSRSLM